MIKRSDNCATRQELCMCWRGLAGKKVLILQVREKWEFMGEWGGWRNERVGLDGNGLWWNGKRIFNMNNISRESREEWRKKWASGALISRLLIRLIFFLLSFIAARRRMEEERMGRLCYNKCLARSQQRLLRDDSQASTILFVNKANYFHLLAPASQLTREQRARRNTPSWKALTMKNENKSQWTWN